MARAGATVTPHRDERGWSRGPLGCSIRRHGVAAAGAARHGPGRAGRTARTTGDPARPQPPSSLRRTAAAAPPPEHVRQVVAGAQRAGRGGLGRRRGHRAPSPSSTWPTPGPAGDQRRPLPVPHPGRRGRRGAGHRAGHPRALAGERRSSWWSSAAGGTCSSGSASCVVVVNLGAAHGHRPAPAAALRGGGHRRLVGLLDALAAHDGPRRLPGQHRLRPRAGGALAHDRQVGGLRAARRHRRCPGSTSARTTRPASWPGSSSASPRPLAAFRLLTPNAVYPVRYSRGRPAHLDVTGERGEAIIRALHDQLGVLATDVEAVRAGRVGRVDAAADHRQGRRRQEADESCIFGKLYAATHVRSDRWYKLGRTLLYGRLEDEKPFHTRAPAGAVRGLHPAAVLRRRAARAAPAGHRGDHPGARVPAGHRVHRRRQGGRRGRDRRRAHRPGPVRRPPDVGDRHGPPRHQAGQPAGAATARCSSSTRPSPRCGPARGGRRSTWPT